MNHQEWLDIGIHRLVADAKSNDAHLAVLQELKRLYQAAGEPARPSLTYIAALPSDATEAEFYINPAYHSSATVSQAQPPAWAATFTDKGPADVPGA